MFVKRCLVFGLMFAGILLGSAHAAPLILNEGDTDQSSNIDPLMVGNVPADGLIHTGSLGLQSGFLDPQDTYTLTIPDGAFLETIALEAVFTTTGLVGSSINLSLVVFSADSNGDPQNLIIVKFAPVSQTSNDRIVTEAFGTSLGPGSYVIGAALSGNFSGFDPFDAAYALSVNTAAGQVDLNPVPVPPAAPLMLLSGAVGALWSRRRS
ncbi:MAG: hypothetical protein AAFX52_13370 [Pseudomonadota bacterium]